MEKALSDGYLAQGREIPADVGLMAHVYSEVLEDIPDRHLSDCFRRALKANRTAFVPTTGEVLAAWDILLGELRDKAAAHAELEARKLQAGHGSMGLMGEREFKARHNLPDDWHRGDPYPPESDLYNVTPPRYQPDPRPVRRPPTSYAWHTRQKAPWEQYPTEENPEVRTVRVPGQPERVFMWWVQRCQGSECRGWVEEHTGPMGNWVRHRPCPYHFTGQPEPRAYVVREDQPEPPRAAAEWDDVVTEEDARAMWQSYQPAD